MKNTQEYLLLVLSGLGCLLSLYVSAIASPDSADPAKRIKGGVKGAAVLTPDGLRKIEGTSADIRRLAELIAGEVTRKDEVVTKAPNFVPGGGVIPPVPQPTGTIPFGNLPARKEVLDRFMRQISYKVQALHITIDALIIPPDREKDLGPLWSKIKLNMLELQKHYDLLAAATSEPPYNKTRIGREALSVFSCAERIEKLRRKASKRLKQK